MSADLKQCSVWKQDKIKEICMQSLRHFDFSDKQIMQLLRCFFIGAFNSPPIFHFIEVIGLDEALKRLKETKI